MSPSHHPGGATVRTTPQQTIERALELATRTGADGCVVLAEESSEANLRWANNTLTTNGVMRGRTLTVIATVGGAQGTAAGVVSRSAVTDATLADIVDAAVAAARGGASAEDAQPLAEPPTYPLGGPWDEEPAETSIEVFADLAPALGDVFDQARSGGRATFGFAEHQLATTYLGSSTGLRLRHDQPTGRLEFNAKSADLSRSAWAGAATRDFRDVDIPGLDAACATRLGWAERRVDLAPGRYETILPPGALADLMIYLYWSGTARDAHDGRTVFSRPGGGTRVGDALANLAVTLRSDPAYPGLESAPFVVAPASGAGQSVFDNGLPLGPTAWLRDGCLDALIQTRHSAALTGLPVTPAVDNLVLDGPPGGGAASGDGAARSLPEMVAGTGRGLLLTCLWYIREVDPQTLLLTGITRDGVYLVEGGEVVGAANNFRFNESPVDLLGRLDEVGRTEITLCREWNDFFTRTAMPPVRIGDFNMSTVSQAS
jgi:predicted Zn-dependent protease